jgi:hypothetical protein
VPPTARAAIDAFGAKIILESRRPVYGSSCGFHMGGSTPELPELRPVRTAILITTTVRVVIRCRCRPKSSRGPFYRLFGVMELPRRLGPRGH